MEDILKSNFERNIEKEEARAKASKKQFESLAILFGGLSFGQYRELSPPGRKEYRMRHGRPRTLEEKEAQKRRNLRNIERRRAANKSRAINYKNAR